MKYYLALLFSLFSITSLWAQDEVRIVSSTRGNITEQNSLSSINPVYSHKGHTMSADSGIFYKDKIGREFFEAFGNIVIHQSSGTLIYADKLHYEASTQTATLYNNIRMVNPNSVLTTNNLVYKMRDRVGIYTGGGRIVSQADTITSKTAYYFEDSQDAYFRNKVIVRTPDVKIYTDSMLYNGITRITNFYGPTNIKGNKGENLYTEKGNYNTATGVARFSKNNLYTEGSRFLKGDSLYYERQSGTGKAFKNVVFVDTTDKFYAYGGYGLYSQADSSITMTENPLIITVVKKDSADQSAPDSLAFKKEAEPNKKDKKNKEKADKETVLTQQQQQQELDKDGKKTTKELPKGVAVVPPATAESKPVSYDSVYTTADTLYSKVIFLKDYKPLHFNLDRNGGALEVEKEQDYGDDEDDEESAFGIDLPTDSSSTVAVDSLPNKAIATAAKAAQVVKKNVAPKAKGAAIVKKTNDSLSIDKTLKQDSLLRQKAVIPALAEADNQITKALAIAKTPDSTTTLVNRDSAYLDTARTRIIKAYHNVRLYKSDLQAVADSAYYGMADSMFRFMGKPMIWSQGSQIAADTIYMQAVNQKLDNALLIGNAFMVNAVLDSLKFNQLKGRKITAFFANNAIEKIFVDGNAENLIFSTNDQTHTITEMFHDRGSRIKITMEDKKIIDYITVRKVDQKVYPFKLVTQENEVLPGFIWRPQDRPTSKEDMMNRKRGVEKEAIKPTAEGGNNAESNAVKIDKKKEEQLLEAEIEKEETTKEETSKKEKKEEAPALNK